MTSAIAAPPHAFDLRIGEQNEEKLGQLCGFGSYWCWAQQFEPGPPPLRLFEWTPKGIAEFTTEHYSFHVVKAGVPHTIDGLFGYWLISDADHIWLQVPRTDRRYYVLIAGGRSGVNRAHAITWYCHTCGTRVGEPQVLEHDGTPAGFLRAQAPAVEAFNSEPVRRTCPGCGALHPNAHPFQARPESGDESPRILAPPRIPGDTRDGTDQASLKLADLMESTPVVVRVDGDEVAVLRIGENVHAISNVCPHKGAPLGFGEVHNSVVTCPWHRFRFDLASGQCLSNPRLRARVYQVTPEGGNIVISKEEPQSHPAEEQHD